MTIGIALRLPAFFPNGQKHVPFQQKEARHIAAFMYKMFLRHGCLLEIISDQGREFYNQIADVLEELTSFKHRMTSVQPPVEWAR